MGDNFKWFFFGFVFVYAFYEALCLTSSQRQPVPFKSSGDASLAFITGEGGQLNPVKPGSQKPPQTPSNVPGRDFVNPKPGAVQNVATTPKSTTKAPGRDFVNPNFKPGGTPQAAPRDPFPTLKPLSNTPITQGTPGRDFVNPNFKPGVTPPAAPRDPFPTLKSPTNTPGQGTPGRDFVNPNLKPGGAPPATPKDPFPALKPPGSKPSQATPGRDFVNPNFKPGAPKPPREPFPALGPPVGLSNIGIVPGGSYAQKAANGVTTPRPDSPTKVDSVTKPPLEGPRDDELREFSEALLKKDVNNAFKYVTLNVQGRTTSQSKNDEAPAGLLEVHADAFKIPTIEKIRMFYNNYILEVTENEYVTPQEKNEENDLIDAMAATPVMQHTRNLLIQHGKISKDPKDFKDLLKTTWFSMYSRGQGRVGSSGFEHVFLAELKKDKGEVSGLHNWIYFHEAEKTNLANYLGYMKKVDLGEKGAILKFHFTLNGTDKPVNSIFVGTSPELEMALYTTCYVFRANGICPLQLAGHRFIVRAFSLKYRGKQLLGSAFPEI